MNHSSNRLYAICHMPYAIFHMKYGIWHIRRLTFEHLDTELRSFGFLAAFDVGCGHAGADALLRSGRAQKAGLVFGDVWDADGGVSGVRRFRGAGAKCRRRGRERRWRWGIDGREGWGNPLGLLGTVTGVDEMTLSVMTGRILPLMSAILPLWLVRSMVNWKETREVWPALVCAGLSFAAMQFYWSNFMDNSLVD